MSCVVPGLQKSAASHAWFSRAQAFCPRRLGKGWLSRQVVVGRGLWIELPRYTDMFPVFSPVLHPCFLPCLLPLIPGPSNGNRLLFHQNPSASTWFLLPLLCSCLLPTAYLPDTVSIAPLWSSLFHGFISLTVICKVQKREEIKALFQFTTFNRKSSLTFMILKSELCRTEDSIQVCRPHRKKARRTHPLIQMEFIFGCSLCFIPINLYLAAIWWKTLFLCFQSDALGCPAFIFIWKRLVHS